MASEKKVATPAQRRERNRAEVVASILQAARSLMGEQGAAALNLHEVARRVGLRTQSLYYYFPSKMALYDALFQLGVELFREERDKALGGQGSIWDEMRAVMYAYMGFAQRQPELWSLVFERPVPGFQPSEQSMEQARALLTSAADRVSQAMASGSIESGLTVAQTLDFIDAVMHGLTSSHIANEPQLPAGQGRFGGLIDTAVRLFEHAWGKEQHSGEQQDGTRYSEGSAGQLPGRPERRQPGRRPGARGPRRRI